MLFGGSRSGKTFLVCRAIATRAIKAPGSRHAILRFRFNAVKSAIVYDTWPKMLALCWPGVRWELNKTDWFAQAPNGAQVWFGGLDDKERTEKILGQEYASIFLNECSQIPWASRNIAVTRLAQAAPVKVEGMAPGNLALKMYYDENPPGKGHWTYRLFRERIDPDTRKPLARPEDFASMLMNPADNAANLPAGYMDSLRGLSSRMRARFLEGQFADVAPGALWSSEMLDKWRSAPAHGLPDMQRIIIAVDPSGSGDDDNVGNDEIGIIVAGLGMDGNGYVLEDLTCKTGPKGWGTVATTAFDRHAADAIVAETNFGGDMVRFVVQTAKPNVPFKKLTASRGKAVRAEPIAALTEQGRIRFAGDFPELEDELCAFTTNGYMGERSPNRADAFVWAMSELFPGMTRREDKTVDWNTRPAGIGIG